MNENVDDFKPSSGALMLLGLFKEDTDSIKEYYKKQNIKPEDYHIHSPEFLRET